jgi:hypothetical protein
MSLEIAWYIAPYKRWERAPKSRPTRICAMDDYTDQIIKKDGGNWREVEILGNRAVVKVKAETTTLATLDSVFLRIPGKELNDSLATVDASKKTSIVAQIADMGYSDTEVRAKFGVQKDLTQFKLKDVLEFMATRRFIPRYDAEKDEIVCDGPSRPTNPLSVADEAVK